MGPLVAILPLAEQWEVHRLAWRAAPTGEEPGALAGQGAQLGPWAVRFPAWRAEPGGPEEG